MLLKIKMIFLSLLAWNLSATAAGIDTSSQDLLIKKLTQIQLNLAPADASRNSVLLRLADLHAERARLLSMQEINDGCTICKAGETDRNKAVTFYSEALAKSPESTRAKVHLQLGHLYELQGQPDKAEKNYSQILTLSSNPLELAEAHLSLAENAFRKTNYSVAMKNYEQVLSIDGASSQGLAAYRKAWCSFKLGHSEQAIDQLKAILTNPKLQSRMAIARGVADNQFLEEVSRDMVTFMGARGIKSGDVEMVYNLTPENFRLQQVTLLAREGLRLGQKEMDLKVWQFLFEKHADAKIRLESKGRQAQLLFDLKKISEAQSMYSGALSLWSANGCTEVSCDEIYKGLRQFVIGWNRIEIQKPSNELITAYQEYLKVFPQDIDMQIWTAQAMALSGQFVAAAELGLKTNSQLAVGKDSSKLEKNLLLTIENAEKAKNEKLLLAAQDDYLLKSILKQKAHDVEYQKAYGLYQKENYPVASELLHGIAMGSGSNSKIKLQAAELAMDAVALMKDDVKMQAWSSEFAGRFPDKKSDFISIYQKTILNQAAAKAQISASEALQILSQFNVSAASIADKKVYLKNKILLSEKVNQITVARVAVDDYLRLQPLSFEETEFALQRKAWFAELELDFATALKTLESAKNTSITNDQRILKLALFAELAEKDPQAYYSQFLKQSKDTEKKALIALRLIRVSKTPEKELAAMKQYLDSQPELFAEAAMDVYSLTKNKKLLENLAKMKAAQKSPAVSMASRILFTEGFLTLKKKLESHQINPKTSKTLASTLKERVKILDQLDALTNQAIASSDWASQVLSLDLVAKENKRFYTEVLTLPTPEGLTGDDEQQYLGLLTQQVAPHQAKAEMAEVKVKEFWSDKALEEKYVTAITAHPDWTRLIQQEITLLSSLAPAEQKASLARAMNQPVANRVVVAQPSREELEQARRTLKQNPFDVSSLKNILELEKKAARPAMVEYLESRIAGLVAPTAPEKEIK